MRLAASRVTPTLMRPIKMDPRMGDDSPARWNTCSTNTPGGRTSSRGSS